jgi:hypothetical protein
VIGQLRRVLQHVFVDVQLVLDLLGQLTDLCQLIVDLQAGAFKKVDELCIVGKLCPLGCSARR